MTCLHRPSHSPHASAPPFLHHPQSLLRWLLHPPVAALLRRTPWSALLGLLLVAVVLAGMPAAQAATGAAGSVSQNAALAASAVLDAPDEAPLPHPDTLRQQLEAIEPGLTTQDDARQRLLQINAIGSTAERLVSRRAAELADLDSRLAGLGDAPAAGAPPEAADVAAQRKLLNRQRAALDADLRLARLVGVDAQQRASELSRLRRSQFHAALTARTASPLGREFWERFSIAQSGDAQRYRTLWEEIKTAASASLQPDHRGAFWLLIGLALLAAVPGAWMAEHLLLRVLPRYLPAGRLRRSLLATLSVVVRVALIGFAVQWCCSALQLGGAATADVRALGKELVGMAAFAAFVTALGRALLAPKRSSWRLLPMSDALAARLSPFPWWLGVCAALGGLAIQVNTIVGASLPAEVSTQAALALVMATIMGGLILALQRYQMSTLATASPALVETATGHGHGAAADDDAMQAPGTAGERPMWVSLLVIVLALAIVATVVLVALGFVALAGAVTRQMVWSAVIASCGYLLYVLIDDLFNGLLSSRSPLGGRLQRSLGISASLLDQLAVILSGVLRLTLMFYLAIALFAPFATAPDELFRRGSSGEHGFSIAGIALAPQSLLTALAIAVGGFFLVGLVKRWLTERYFPHTSLDPGMRSSVVTLLGYVGGIAVIAFTLASLGISVERIAWVASALSVGIGFGLQAIVQNFISGLILLAERPVKVGDRVKLGDNEGDIHRINVRATEIRLGDRSTVIVPNSEFITKTVRNITLGDAEGRVLLRLPAPLNTDARRMRDIILQAFRAHPSMLTHPEPSVTLEGIQAGTLTFLAIGYVNSPRVVGGVVSDLLFSILESLRSAGLSLSPPATTSIDATAVTAADADTGTDLSLDDRDKNS